MTTQADINRLAHESLLRELHNIDGIAETFARTAILVVVALMAFVSAVRTQDAILVSFSIGLLISGLMVFKASRHRKIFVECYKRITSLQKSLGINAIREFPADKEFLCCLDGFSLLGYLGIGFFIAWVVILLLSLFCGFLVANA